MNREIAISIDEKLLADLDATAEKELRSRSNMVSVFIIGGLNKYHKAASRKSRRATKRAKR